MQTTCGRWRARRQPDSKKKQNKKTKIGSKNTKHRCIVSLHEYNHINRLVGRQKGMYKRHLNDKLLLQQTTVRAGDKF